MKRSYFNPLIVRLGIVVVVVSVVVGGLHQGSFDSAGAGDEGIVFGPVGSGFWYPAAEKDLRNMVDSFLADAHVEGVEGRIVALIAPHAGLPWSGPCAAFSFKPLKKQKIDRVIILAPSHSGGFRGISVLRADYYKTPLGLIKLDIDACKGLLPDDHAWLRCIYDDSGANRSFR